jgi:hypothetical protein
MCVLGPAPIFVLPRALIGGTNQLMVVGSVILCTYKKSRGGGMYAKVHRDLTLSPTFSLM